MTKLNSYSNRQKFTFMAAHYAQIKAPYDNDLIPNMLLRYKSQTAWQFNFNKNDGYGGWLPQPTAVDQPSRGKKRDDHRFQTGTIVDCDVV